MALGKLEGDFWAKFRKGMLSLRPGGKQILLDRIESPGTGRGIPDAHMTDPDFGDCWIELKVARGNRIILTPLQVVWLNIRAEAGSRCRIVAFDPKLEIIHIYDGMHAQLISERGIAVPARKVQLGHGADDWSRVRDRLYYDRTGHVPDR